jgi:hypothetical protein
MCPYQSHIGRLWLAIAPGQILLYCKSEPPFMSEFHSTRALTNILTPDRMLDDSKIQHLLHLVKYRLITWLLLAPLQAP